MKVLILSVAIRQQVPVYHLFPVDQVVGLGDQVHQFRDAAGPVVENSIDVLSLERLEVDDSVQSVDFGRHRLARDQARQELFRLIGRQVQKDGHPLERDSRVIFRHDSNVVLDNSRLERLPAFLSFFSPCK